MDHPSAGEGKNTLPSLYDAARSALSQALRIDEVQSVRDEAERMRLYAKQAKDRGLMADAMEIQLRAERKLGELLIAAKAAGQLSQGGRPRTGPIAAKAPAAVPKTRSREEPVTERVTLAEAGIDRKLSMKAQQLAAVPEKAFEVVLDRAREKIVSGGGVVVNPARDLTQSEKRDRRDERATVLSAKHRALPVVKVGLIYADPAWKDEEVWSDESGMDRAADNQYPTMTLAEVMALDVGAIAADDCILLLWAKTNNLMEAFCVAMSWGFAALVRDEETGFLVPDKSTARYASAFAWDKQIMGTGRWVRDLHEHLLIFRRGKPVAPAPGTQLPSILSERKTEHSRKPEAFLDWIDRVWPDEVKIELNRRGAPRPGWMAWGNEAEDFPAPPQDADEEDDVIASSAPYSEDPPLDQGKDPAGDALDVNAVIRDGYARNLPLEDLAALTGLTGNAVKQRAKRMKLGDPERQRAAVSAANRRRAAVMALNATRQGTS